MGIYMIHRNKLSLANLTANVHTTYKISSGLTYGLLAQLGKYISLIFLKIFFLKFVSRQTSNYGTSEVELQFNWQAHAIG